MNTSTLKPVSTATGALIDRYGRLKADEAELKNALSAIKEELVDRGIEKEEGELFRIAITNTLRETVDWKAVALALVKRSGIGDKALDNLVIKNTTLTETTTVRCSARLGTVKAE